VALHVIAGRLPTDLTGHHFVTSARPEGGGVFAFSGNGMVHRCDFGTSRPRLISRWIKTPCYWADRATQGTWDAFRNLGGGPGRMSFSLGVRNQANTALIPLGPDRVLATTDAGRPYELDPVTLEVATPVGRQSEWRRGMDIPGWLGGIFRDDVFPLVQSSAHPAWDPHTRQLFTANFGGNMMPSIFGQPLFSERFTDLVRWDGAGPLERWSLVLPSGAPVRIEQSVHQVTITANHVLLTDTAFRVEPEKLIDPRQVRAQDPTAKLYVVSRADLDATPSGGAVQVREVTLPREAVHVLADYDDAAGVVTLHVQHNCASDGSEWVLPSDRMHGSGAQPKSDLLGFVTAPTDVSLIGRYRIDATTGQILDSVLVGDDALTWGLSLYALPDGVIAPRHGSIFHAYGGFDPDLLPSRVAQAYAGYPHRRRPLSSLSARPGALLRFDCAQAKIVDAYAFPPGRVPSSPEFAPNAPGSNRGYVVCTVVSDDKSWTHSSGDELWVFDSQDLARGPLCRLGHPDLELPFTLHTAWLPEVRPRTAPYRVDQRAELAPEVDWLPFHLRDLFATQEQLAAPLVPRGPAPGSPGRRWPVAGRLVSSFFEFVNVLGKLPRPEQLRRVPCPHLHFSNLPDLLEETGFTTLRIGPERPRDDEGCQGIVPVAKSTEANAFSTMITIGRAANNDLIVPDERVSKFHGFFKHAGGVWTFTDANSTNGTKLNDRPLVPGVARPVVSGTRFEFSGGIEARFLAPLDVLALLRELRVET
jgi:carotenoid cleavage dioxygenase-like enzyme